MTRTTTLTATLALCLWACDDGKGPAGDTSTDTEADTSVDVADEDLAQDSPPDAVEEDGFDDTVTDTVDEDLPGDVEDEEVVVPLPDLAFVYTVAADYSTGSYSVLDLGDLGVTADIGTMATDGKALCIGGRIFLNELYGADTVDPVSAVAPHAILGRHTTGAFSNPVDAVHHGADHLLVVLNGSTGLVELDPSDGTLGTVVDLSAFDDDGVPDVHAIAHVGSRYYVSLERLDSWTAVDVGLVVILDDATLAVIDADPSTAGTVDAIALPGANPIGRFRALGDDLYIALTGLWGATDGGVAVVHTATASSEWVVSGSDLGGDPVFGDCMEIVDASTGFVCTGLTDGSADAVIEFDPSDGTASTAVLTTSSGSLSGSALASDGRMLVGDRDPESPGVRVIDTSTSTELTTSPIAVGANPPYSLCVHPAP